MKNKRAQAGESILMMYRIFLLIIIAIAVYFISSLAFDYTIDTKNIEASLLGNEIIECVSPILTISEETISVIKSADGVLDYCGILGANMSYVSLNITDDAGDEVLFVEDNTRYREQSYLYNTPYANTDETQKYKPGIFSMTKIIYSEDRTLTLQLEVHVAHEI